ncbi:MAG: inorganic phosphate transporter [Candidatus Levybacteria bacterium]|nr:inorganic phosphate transporter [Candidatus Levybacteria bacterium]
MGDAIPLLFLVIILSIIFDFINGFHDTANAIATVISTRVLSPFWAIIMAASLNFLGAISGTEVAKTIGSGIIGTNVPQHAVIAALSGAIIWNLVTWHKGLPSSSSHALIGGLVGSGIAYSGTNQVHWDVLFQKVIIPLFGSPVVGFFAGFILMKFIFNFFFWVRPGIINSFFRRAQIISSAFMAFSHGSNDAQKTMGIITLALIASGTIPAQPFHIPLWVIIISALAMALGTAGGGWRIIHTMGTKLVNLTPVYGFGAETAAATIIETASRFGLPLSTTHVISSTILGVGASKRLNAVRWNVARQIFKAWGMTIFVSAGIAFLVYKATTIFFP